jgi:hypothetical protein
MLIPATPNVQESRSAALAPPTKRDQNEHEQVARVPTERTRNLSPFWPKLGDNHRLRFPRLVYRLRQQYSLNSSGIWDSDHHLPFSAYRRLGQPANLSLPLFTRRAIFDLFFTGCGSAW